MSVEKRNIINERELHDLDFLGWEEKEMMGRDHERRFHLLLKELEEEGIFDRVTRASRRQDHHGIDFFGHIKSDVGSIKIPFQVKGSAVQAQHFRDRHKSLIGRKHILIVIVSDKKTDAAIKENLIEDLHLVWGSILERNQGALRETQSLGVNL